MEGIIQRISEFLEIPIPDQTIKEDDISLGELNKEAICRLIPERGRALFAQKAVLIQGENSSKVLVSMPILESFCEGHMPGCPILPLGIGGWMLSQAGEILISSLDQSKGVPLVYKTGPVESKNKDFLRPGDTLLVIAKLKNRRLGIYEIDTEGWLGHQLVLSVTGMMYGVANRQLLKGIKNAEE